MDSSDIVEEFARSEYETYILIDFNNTTQQIRDLFVHYLYDLDTFFMYLALYSGVTLHPRSEEGEGRSLIVFDEVQRFPEARAAIKYLVKDRRYDYIETGSLVSIKKNVKDITIPSEEESIEMHPMDLEEFLWAMGQGSLMQYLRVQYTELKPVGQDMHRRAMTWLRQYMIVGGMPQTVLAYAETRDFAQVDRQKRLILTLYRNDISQYANGLETRVTRIFDEIPAQLQRHEKRFRLGDLQPDARYRDFGDAFFWLEDAKVVNVCRKCTEPNVGFRLTADGNSLKCYMVDTGLLISHAFDENGIVDTELYKRLMLEKLEVNGGMIMENLVAQMLVAAGHKLYYFNSYSKNAADDRMEIDFLITKVTPTNRHNVVPIEVKSGKNYTMKSLDKFRKKYASMISMPLVVHAADLKSEGDVLFLPLYMTPLL